jgi:hypothetical protein
MLLLSYLSIRGSTIVEGLILLRFDGPIINLNIFFPKKFLYYLLNTSKKGCLRSYPKTSCSIHLSSDYLISSKYETQARFRQNIRPQKILKLNILFCT